MPWNGTPGADDAAQGVYADHVDVALIDDQTDVDYNVNPTFDACSSDPSGQSDTQCETRTWRVLGRFFKTNFQTYGRTVKFIHVQLASGWQTSIQKMADDVAAVHPFAALVVRTPQWPQDVDLSGIDTHGVQYFEFHAGAFPFLRYSISTLSPSVWSVDESLENIEDTGASWVCRSIAGRVPTQSSDPSIRAEAALGTPRKMALAYDRADIQAAAREFLDRTNRLCGSATPGGVFDQLLQIEAAGPGFGYTPQKSAALAAAAVRQMRDAGDTSLLCFLCSYTYYFEQGPDDFSKAEAAAQYFPEYLFISGEAADPFFAQYKDPATYGNAFGLTDLWQVPAFLETYWDRAYRSVDPTNAARMVGAIYAYEELMQLFGAIQLAGPSLNADSAARGLYTWRRSFRPSSFTGTAAGGGPAAGYSPSDHSFLKGMMEERWDSQGVPPGPDSALLGFQGGCFRIIDYASRYGTPDLAADPRLGLKPWPKGIDATAYAGPNVGAGSNNGDHSTELSADAPCTASYYSMAPA